MMKRREFLKALGAAVIASGITVQIAHNVGYVAAHEGEEEWIFADLVVDENEIRRAITKGKAHFEGEGITLKAVAWQWRSSTNAYMVALWGVT